ncbi:MAG: hypothetical protein KIT27_12105 [Legionellales bacterium]|nr:hypothetical protein [Legionellales bacterium]
MRFIYIFFLFLTPIVSYGITTFDCSFVKSSSEDGIQYQNKPLKFKFIVSKEKSFMVGSNGSTEINTVLNSVDKAITFIEVTPINNVHNTTILLKTGKAIHSRHTVLSSDEILPSQFYGKCQIF